MKYLLPLLLLVLIGCPNPPDPEEDRDTTITLELIDTWTTTVTLKISVTDTTKSWGFALSQNDSIVQIDAVAGSDTTIIDGGLDPNRDYTYIAYFTENGEIQDSSQALTVTTMDTTSHGFAGEVDILGLYGSRLRDVVIIDENNIWVVGIIIMPDPDSSYNGTGKENFNAAHWDGNEWTYHAFGAGSVELDDILYFADDDIWVCSGAPMHWDGGEWTLYHLWDMGILTPDEGGVIKAWGMSSSDIHFVGGKGTIVHYDGTTFTKIASGTNVDLIDIDGTPDGEYMYAIAYKNTNWWGNQVLEYKDNNWEVIYEIDNLLQGSDDYGAVFNVSIYADTAYISTFVGLWKYNIITKSSTFIASSTYDDKDEYFQTERVIAASSNNVFMVSTYCEVAHFNGVSWTVSDIVTQTFGAGNAWSKSADYTGELFSIVGYIQNPPGAFIMRGKYE